MSQGRKPSPPLEYGKRTQGGDPQSKTPDDVLSAEDLMGRPSVQPVTTGPIAMPKKCGWCQTPLAATAEFCPKCVPDGKVQRVSGINLAYPMERVTR